MTDWRLSPSGIWVNPAKVDGLYLFKKAPGSGRFDLDAVRIKSGTNTTVVDNGDGTFQVNAASGSVTGLHGIPSGGTIGQTLTKASSIDYDAVWQTPSGSGVSVFTVKVEGSTLTASLLSLDFVGAGVTATAVGGAVTVTIPGASGGLSHSYLGTTPSALQLRHWVPVWST